MKEEAGALRWMLAIFGVILLLGVVLPWNVPRHGAVQFWWTGWSHHDTFSRVWPFVLFGSGLLAVLGAGLPLAGPGRAWLAVAAGALGLAAWYFVDAPSYARGFQQRGVLPVFVAGLALAPAGLVFRSRRRASLVARGIATAGAACLLVVFLAPHRGVTLLGHLADALGHTHGKDWLHTSHLAWGFLLFLAAVATLAVWLPPEINAAERWIAGVLLLHAPVLLLLGEIGAAIMMGGDTATLARSPIAWLGVVNLLGFGVLFAFGVAELGEPA